MSESLKSAVARFAALATALPKKARLSVLPTKSALESSAASHRDWAAARPRRMALQQQKALKQASLIYHSAHCQRPEPPSLQP